MDNRQKGGGPHCVQMNAMWAYIGCQSIEDQVIDIIEYFENDASKFCHERWRRGLTSRLDAKFHRRYILEAIVRHGIINTAIDIGSGPGQWAACLACRSLNYIAVDLSLGMLSAPIYKNITNGRRIVADVRHLPISSEVVDFVLCSHVLEYQYELEGCLAEIARILRVGGRVVIFTKNRRAIPWFTMQQVLNCLRTNPIPSQVWRRAEDIAASEGFVTEDITYISARLPTNPNDVHDGFASRFENVVPFNLGNLPASSRLGKLFGWHLAVTLKKL